MLDECRRRASSLRFVVPFGDDDATTAKGHWRPARKLLTSYSLILSKILLTSFNIEGVG